MIRCETCLSLYICPFFFAFVSGICQAVVTYFSDLAYSLEWVWVVLMKGLGSNRHFCHIYMVHTNCNNHIHLEALNQHHFSFFNLLKIIIGGFLEFSCIYLLSCAATDLWKLVCTHRILLLHAGFGNPRLLLSLRQITSTLLLCGDDQFASGTGGLFSSPWFRWDSGHSAMVVPGSSEWADELLL
jgi:hypothetical protein